MINPATKRPENLIGKAVFAGLAIACLWLSLDTLQIRTAYAPYAALVSDVQDGRSEPSDLNRIAPLLDQNDRTTCTPETARINAILHLYRTDLVARENNLSPFIVTTQGDLGRVRQNAQKGLANSLTCNPMDGDLWLRLAILERSRATPETQVNRLLNWSKRTTPHEGPTLKRRNQFFPK